MKSRTYQLSATPDATNAGDEVNFSHAIVRLLARRGLARRDQPGRRRFPSDSACAAGAFGPPSSPAHRAGSRFLKTFGKPDRLLDLRMRAVRIDHAGPGVSDDQRRDRPPVSWNATRTGSAHCLDAGRQ